MASQFLITIAQTQDERLAAFRLRYRIFVEEMEYEIPSADSETGIYEDEDEHACILLAYDTSLPDHPLVGTATIDFGSNTFSQKTMQNYGIESFAGDFSLESLSVIRKVLVEKAYRGTTLFMEIVYKMYRLYHEKNVLFSFIDCSPYLILLYEKIGYRRFAPRIYYGEGQVLSVPMIFVVRDLDYLRRIRSPLYRLAKSLGVTAHPLCSEYLENYLKHQAETNPEQMEAPDKSIWVNPMKNTPLFSGIENEDILYILEQSNLNKVPSGGLIVRKNEENQQIHFLKSGYAEVTRSKDGRKIALAVVGPGDIIGEMSFFTRTGYSQNVTAVTECETVQLNSRFLAELKTLKPKLACQIYFNLGAILARRLEITNTWVMKSPPF